MNLLIAALFLCFVFLMGLFPFFLLYLFSDLIYLLVYRVFGYRKKVVLQNLEQTLKGLSREELRQIMKKTYKNLTDILLEGIKGLSMTRNQFQKRHKVLNPSILDSYYEQGKSIICVAGHYGNWEWGGCSSAIQARHKVIGFYKPLSNTFIDRFMRWNRSRYGTLLASIKETSLTFEKCKGTPTLFLMAADQNPSNRENAIWVNFLGRDTAFLHGPEKHARNNNYTVMYVDVQRVKRGFYTVELSLLADNPSALEYGEITARYAQKLESVILKKPEDWLWSHRRWKYSR